MQGLKEARTRAKLTQQKAAAAAGITQNYYCELENGKKKNPTQAVILRLASTLNCTIDELYRGFTQKAKPPRKKKG